MSAVRYLALGLAVGMAWACSAQKTSSTVPLSPDVYTSVHLKLTDEPLAGVHLETSSTRAGFVAPAPAVRTRTADTKFFLLNGIQLGMAVFDVEMTQRCIASHQCRETNPAMPSSQAGQLSVNLAVFAFSSWASYWLKKHGLRVWWLPPAFGAVAHEQASPRPSSINRSCSF